MARIYGNDESSSRDFGDSSQLSNYILDSGETCNMTPQVSDFIPGLLEDIDIHIEVADGHLGARRYQGRPTSQRGSWGINSTLRVNNCVEELLYCFQ